MEHLRVLALSSLEQIDGGRSDRRVQRWESLKTRANLR
jgi:hypothetical protein